MDALEKEKGKIKLTSNVGVAKLNPGTQRSDRAKAQSRTREGMIRRKSQKAGCEGAWSDSETLNSSKAAGGVAG